MMDPQDKIKQLEQSVAGLQQANVELQQQRAAGFQPLGQASRFSNDSELDVGELINTLWGKKWLIMFTAALFAVGSVFFALSLPNMYKSSVLLMPNHKEQGNSGLGGLANQFGGLASLAGINLGGGNSDKTAYALQVIESREFLYKFIQDNQLKVEIMAVNNWNRATDTYSYDPEVYNAETKTWVREMPAPFKPEPSLHETYLTFLQDNLSVAQDKESGMVTIAVSHVSPFLAKALVEKLVDALNETVKLQDLHEATKSIQYLEKELQSTKEVGLQAMFYQLIEQQQQTLMLTKVRSDYVLKIVDKAIVPEQKYKPKRAVIVFLGTLLGAILASVLVLIFSFKVEKE